MGGNKKCLDTLVLKVSITSAYLDHTVAKTVDIYSVFDYIRDGETFRQTNLARKTSSEKEYDKIKANTLCFTPNSYFDKYANLSGFKGFSGLCYIDIDNVPNLTEILQDLRNNPYIFACYTSISGKGIGLLVKLDTTNVTPDNFNSIQDQLAAFLNVAIDRNAKGISRFNVLPHDPAIYVNDDSLTYVPTVQDITPAVSVKNDHATEVKNFLNEDKRPTHKISAYTLLEDYQGKDYIFIKEGKDYAETFIVDRIIPAGRRNSTLTSIASVNIFNNPIAAERSLCNRLHAINKSFCKTPLPLAEVEKIHASVYKQYKAGKLKVKTRKKYTWFSPISTLTLKEKQRIVGQNNALIRGTMDKVNVAISDLYNQNQIITKAEIAAITGLTGRTIQRNWNLDEINLLNQNIKENENKNNESRTSYERSGEAIQVNEISNKSDGDEIYRGKTDIRLLDDGKEAPETSATCFINSWEAIDKVETVKNLHPQAKIVLVDHIFGNQIITREEFLNEYLIAA